jgi:sugar lactone lactonase YvrE
MRLCGLLALLGMLAIPVGAAAQGDAYTVMPYATGLQHPRGLTFDANGNLVVATEGTGNGDGAIWRLSDLNGNGMIDNESEVKPLSVNMPSWGAPVGEGEILGPSGVTYGADGTLYAVTGGFEDPTSNQGFSVWSSIAPNTSTNQLRTLNPYAQLAKYEWANNPDGAQLDSDPYSIVVDADGNAYVNDAAANDTLKVAPDGTITTYAVYSPVAVPAELGLPFPATDAVPTGLAVGPDGALYVSLLTGFPFSEGASTVYRLEDLDGDGTAMGAGEMTVYADGLTTSTALAWSADGHLLATEFRGPLTDLSGQNIATGRVVEWVDGAWETIADGLVTPTGLAVGADGTIYVAMEFADTIMQIHEGS